MSALFMRLEFWARRVFFIQNTCVSIHDRLNTRLLANIDVLDDLLINTIFTLCVIETIWSKTTFIFSRHFLINFNNYFVFILSRSLWNNLFTWDDIKSHKDNVFYHHFCLTENAFITKIYNTEAGCEPIFLTTEFNFFDCVCAQRFQCF